MKKAMIKCAGVTTLLLISGCDSSKDTAVSSSQSAQQAAADYAKSFQATAGKEADKLKSSKQANRGKKPTPTDAGITGLPKGAVEGAKSMADKTKELANKVEEKISTAVNPEGAESAKDNLSKMEAGKSSQPQGISPRSCSQNRT